MNQDQPSTPASKEPKKAEPIGVEQQGFVGNLSMNIPLDMEFPSEYCLDDGKLYKGANHRVATTNVFFQQEPSIDDSWYWKTVLVHGSKENSLWDNLTEIGPCPSNYGQEVPIAQTRSDWVAPEGNYITTKEKLQQHSVITGTSIQQIALVEHSSQDHQTTVQLHNPFTAAMNDLSIQAHYEGGSGKPHPKFIDLDLDLPPGGSNTIQLHDVIDADGQPQQSDRRKGFYHLSSIDISGDLGQLSFDVSIFIGRARKR